jgi:hypothetical protein
MNLKLHTLFAIVILSLVGMDAKAVQPPKFTRIFVFVLENQDFWIANLESHLASLSNKGLLLTNYKATTHPSQPNYISMIAGDTMGVKSNGDNDVEGRNLVDLLEEKGLSWKAYQEDYPENCFAKSAGKYKRKHNPFISMNAVRNNPERCAKIVNADQLWKDLESDSLPHFMFYTPNNDNNGHDTTIFHAGKWSSKFVHKLLEHKAIREETLVILTFDEGLYIGKNKVFTLLIGNGINPGTMDNTRYTHYSLLKSVEENFGLESLGRKDADAVAFKYLNNPPGFLMTIPVLIGIVIATSIVFFGLLGVSIYFIRKGCIARRAQKLENEKPEPNQKYENDRTELISNASLYASV